jgi:alpha-methylacyl-CoA racemase
MLLADLGADVIRVERLADTGPGIRKELRYDVTRRGRPTLGIDLKSDEGRAAVMKLVARADGLIEGFRPQVMERLGLGPETCLTANPKLVYLRMTGWGQDGAEALSAGHDINYLARSGLLSLLGRSGSKPAIPLNVVADLGGGALYAAFGMLAALRSAERTGEGQVVDVAIVDGLASLLAPYYGYLADGRWHETRESNFIDGGAPWYDVYETADGGWVAVGAIEPKFYANLLRILDLDPGLTRTQTDRRTWPDLRELFTARFATRSRDEWAARFDGAEACVSPVLGLSEAAERSLSSDRPTVYRAGDVYQPMPAPRFDRTEPGTPKPATPIGTGTRDVLTGWGWDAADIDTLLASGKAR